MSTEGSTEFEEYFDSEPRDIVFGSFIERFRRDEEEIINYQRARSLNGISTLLSVILGGVGFSAVFESEINKFLPGRFSIEVDPIITLSLASIFIGISFYTERIKRGYDVNSFTEVYHYLALAVSEFTSNDVDSDQFLKYLAKFDSKLEARNQTMLHKRRKEQLEKILEILNKEANMDRLTRKLDDGDSDIHRIVNKYFIRTCAEIQMTMFGDEIDDMIENYDVDETDYPTWRETLSEWGEPFTERIGNKRSYALIGIVVVIAIVTAIEFGIKLGGFVLSIYIAIETGRSVRSQDPV